MLLINWEIFNPSDKSGKYEAEIKDYELKTGYLKKKYAPVGMVRFVNTQVADDLKGQPIPPCTIPLVARDGLTEWAYTANTGNIRRTKDGVVTLTRKSRIMKQGELLVDVSKDIDLIYFIVEKSPLFKKGVIKIDDARERQEEQVKKEKDSIRLKTAIYGDASPLTSEAMLRQVCHSVGISGADTKTEAALRLGLEQFIKAEDKKHDVRAMTTENFLDFINMSDEIMRRGVIGKAVNRKIIEYTKQYGWVWGISRETIVRVPEARFQDKFPYLCEFFANETNKDKWDALLKELAEQGYFESDNPYEELKWLAKQLGIKTSQVNKTELSGKIVEYLKA